MPVTEKLLIDIVLPDPEGQWELHRGRLREKPPMSAEHTYAYRFLTAQFVRQVDDTRIVVSPNAGRLARADESNYIPDIFVFEKERETAARRRREPLEIYRDPMLLVVEIWSPSTGQYDIDEKLPEYMRRGDREIWRVHPYERTLRGWRRQPDGSYEEFIALRGVVQPVALPGVTIDLDALFAPPE